MKTMLLKNGRIIGGTGRKVFYGHILISGGRIRSVIEDDTLPEADFIMDGKIPVLIRC